LLEEYGKGRKNKQSERDNTSFLSSIIVCPLDNSNNMWFCGNCNIGDNNAYN
jgi:hypothetical protein